MAERKGRLKTENSTGRPGPGESAALFFICLVFYGAFAVIDGPRLFPDSQSYISMGITREPLYPLFLALLRRFADAVGWQAAPFSSAPAPYLFLAAFLQSILAAYAAYLLGRRMAERMHERVSSRVMLYLAPATLFCVALLNRFAAGRGAAYHVSILTEGISFSLFVLFVLRCDRFFEAAGRAGKSDVAARRRFVMQAFLVWLDLFLLLSLRKQLAVCAVTLCAAAFVIAATFALPKSMQRSGSARNCRGRGAAGLRIFLAAVCVSALALVSSTGLDLIYNRVLRGSFMQRTGNSEGMCCTLLYTARESDAELFADPSERALFEKVYAEAYAKGSLYE
ncbi:MAG: hypothetical protein J6I56_07480, partial [Lachnospiraceae bacterium]|nr:hypothetical protein [Lachnospiraceae bacterium]